MVKVKENKCGWIGCLVTRAAFKSGNLDTVAIIDPFFDLNYMIYKTQYDAVHCRFNGTVKAVGSLSSRKSPCPSSRSKSPTKIKWGDAGADYVVKFTDVLTTLEKDGTHLKGVNHKRVNSLKIINNVSCTTNCLDPWSKVIHGNFGIMEGLMTKVHTMAATQKMVDGPSGKLWCNGQGAAQNIILISTGKVIPELNGKLSGMVFCVPISNISIVDLICCLEKVAKFNDIKEVVKQASQGPLKGILGYTESRAVP
ncbi:Glyceraldehyde-3-phosphate dehydrogenase [Galemys pyrenaicus]|uniref:Glyceraldehyde-3-phosphate dehydrogenase n=1 Tax=Galemys pyrenaicus TaxID=202257 RepID=A0A8J6DNA3_GALPY|nr:Glyceraldehyde-3-phosphate dehydrogenase [Galemys pyrenaicus]